MTSNWQDIRCQAQTDILSYMALLRPETKLGKHHYFFRDVIKDLYDKKLRFVCLSCPPRHSKSYTFSQALPAWWLGNRPRDQVIATSYASSLAQNFGTAVRADMSSELYGSVFSAESQPSGKSMSGSDFSTNAGGKYKATGVGGSLTGFGGDLIIVDDPIKNAETADSPRYKEMLEKFFGETLYTRLMPGGVIVVMMTRWRDDDLTGYILKNFDDWTYINIPSIVEEQDLGTAGSLGRGLGEALWPEFFTSNDLNRTRKVLGEKAFQALYQGRPVSQSSSTVKASDIVWLSDYDAEPVFSFWSWDLALTDNSTSDYSVGQYWQLLGNDKLVLTDYVRKRLSFVELVNEIEAQAADKPGTVVLEKSLIGLTVGDELAKRDNDLDVELIQPKGSKLQRLQFAMPVLKSGIVEFVHFDVESDAYSDFDECLDELLKAGLTAHDDFLDSFTQAMLYAKDNVLSNDRSEVKLAKSGRSLLTNKGTASQVSAKTSLLRRKQIGWY